MRQIFLQLFISVVFCIYTYGQANKNLLDIGEKKYLFSTILKEQREMYVYSPDVSVQFPLIIVFDGESLFTPVVSAVRFMNYAQEMPLMPEAVVVGLFNTDRNRDMPIPQSYGGKGEENFSKFISEELIPDLSKKYTLNGQIILIGHSQGGLFVSYAMANSPALFSMTIALDAPLDVDSKTAEMKQKLTTLLQATENKLKYASMETAYGWGKDWPTLSKSDKIVRMKYLDESHESMPLKAIYDGLKFLYKDFSPPKKDMKLISLLHYYKDVSDKLGYRYGVPQNVALTSARRNINNGQKTDAMDLLSFSEQTYGASDQISNLKSKAAQLANTSNPVVDFYLDHAKPSGQEIKPYMGRWVGELVVPGGQPTPIDFEILMEDGKAKMLSVLPWPPYNKEESEILFVSKEGLLVFGRKNRGQGLSVSTAHIDKNGNLIGKEELVGFTIPEGVPEDVKAMMKFALANPNTFDLKKK